MVPAANKQGGTCLAAPDVCKTPSPGGPVPLPYVNIGMLMQCQKTAPKVKICNKETVTKKSEIPRSQGDEPGTVGGIISNVNMNKVILKKCSSAVYAMGNKVAYLGSMTGQNGSNANMPAGNVIEVRQVKVIVVE